MGAKCFNTGRKMLSRLAANGFVFAALAAGFLSFIFIYGIEPLRVTGLGWLYHGYLGDDITQHQTGWMFFRNSEWTFPLGKALLLGYPEGTSVSFTDSIPLAAIFFKLISGWLPENFQYFGIYTALSFMLQSLFAMKLIHLFTKNKVYSFISGFLFIFSSSLIERAFKHTALASHWLILAAMYLYFRQTKDSGNNNKVPIAFIALCLLALGIHPYLFAMVICVFLCSEISRFRKEKHFGFLLRNVSICLSASLIFGYCIGVFGDSGIDPELGYGIYNLNLNALINPYARDVKQWSLFTPNRPLIRGEQDGIYYVGICAFALFVYLIPIAFLRGKRVHTIINKCREWISRYAEYVVLLIVFTLYAVSNVVILNDSVLLDIRLGKGFVEVLNVFRSSARFFFIPYYTIYLIISVVIYRLFQRNAASIIMGVLVLLQIIDISPAIQEKHEFFETRYEMPEISSEWDVISDNYSQMLFFECVMHRPLAFWLGQHGFRTNLMISAPIHSNAYFERTTKDRERLYQSLLNGDPLDSDTVYAVTTDIGTVFRTEEELDDFIDILRSNYDDHASVEYITNGHKNYWMVLPEH